MHSALSRLYVQHVQLIFSSAGWESWDVRTRPVIPDGMPVLVDDDLAEVGIDPSPQVIAALAAAGVDPGPLLTSPRRAAVNADAR